MMEKFSVRGVRLGLGFPLIIDILFLRLLKWLMIVGVVYQKKLYTRKATSIGERSRNHSPSTQSNAMQAYNAIFC